MNNNELEYYNHFRNANLSYGIPDKDIYSDSPTQVHYPLDKSVFSLGGKICHMLVDAFADIVFVNHEKSQLALQNLINIIKHENVVVITNHSTFAGFPIIIDLLKKVANDNGISNIQNNIYTILGPLLLTNISQRQVILSLSNCLKTIPQSVFKKYQGNEEFSNYLGTISKSFLSYLRQNLKNKGNIYIVSPTGTRDCVCRDSKTGISEKIYFESDSEINPSIRLLKFFAKSNCHFLFAGINDSNLKNPTIVNEKNNSWTCGEVYISLDLVDSQSMLELIETNNVMSTLANNVYDKENVIGQTTDSQTLSALKNQCNNMQYDKNNNPPLLKNDTIFKKLIRKKFE